MALDVVHTPASDTLLEDSSQNILDTVEGEIHFFRALMRSRPVGINRHFHVLTMKESIEKATKQTIAVEDIWRKLENCYNLEALEALEAEYEQNANSSDSSTPEPAASPKDGDNLATHPFFRSEFSLPPDTYIDTLVSERRIRATASPASTSSPAAVAATRSPSEGPVTRRGRKRKASPEPTKADLAGLVSGDSDSSDLTQQSGDEAEGSNGVVQTPSERRATSVEAGTDGGTDNMEDEEEEKGEDEAPRPRRGRKPGRGRGRGSRKRKR